MTPTKAVLSAPTDPQTLTGRPGAPGRRRAGAVAVWAALNLPALLFLLLSGEGGPAQLALGALVLGAAVSLYRTLPLVSFFLCVALWWSVGIVQRDLGAVVVSPYLPAVFVVSFGLGKLTVRPRAVLGVVGLVVLSGSAASVFTGLTPAMWFLLATALVFACQLPWLMGRYVRQRGELQRAGWEHARQLELQQSTGIAQARLRERTRIAEDMHDSLGHELSLMALRAGALQVSPAVDDRVRDLAGELRSNAADALERLRDIIGVLREGDAPARMEPALPDIGDLVDRARDSGVRVELERVGDPGQLPDMTEKALFRVVQEALTNVVKHAPGAAVTVRLAHAPDEVTVMVRNGPAPGTSARPAVRGRRGLAGLDERTRLAGGEFRAVPLPGGGFEVRARLPRTPTVVTTAGTAPVAGPYEDLAEAAVRPEPVGCAGSAEEGLAHATARLRRRSLSVAALPLGLFVCLAVGMLGYYAYLCTSSVLAPRHYERLRLGSTAPEVRTVLPDHEMSDPPSELLPEPDGAECRYYRASGALFVRVDVYRLCFVAGGLMDKHVITAESRAPVDRD
ncbi:histidine kinase [Streptomyces sp. NBC_00111]|uniref:sensor histidine kinase n=1 Tax=Streptomyces sp. NBC_00111 TaxID=2975655 RepID=UPI00324AB31B